MQRGTLHRRRNRKVESPLWRNRRPVSIKRFSNDIDLFLDPLAFQPPLGKKAIDRDLKKLRDAVAEHSALTYVPKDSRTIGGFGRYDRRSTRVPRKTASLLSPAESATLFAFALARRPFPDKPTANGLNIPGYGVQRIGNVNK
jgi:hypothetical protein